MCLKCDLNAKKILYENKTEKTTMQMLMTMTVCSKSVNTSDGELNGIETLTLAFNTFRVVAVNLSSWKAGSTV